MILGVDPGLNGALALYDLKTNRLEMIEDVPTVAIKTSKDKKIRKHLDLFALSQFVQTYKYQILGTVIEDVHSMPNQGVASTFKFGLVTGQLMGVIASILKPMVKVSPVVWKALNGLSRDKNESRLKAMELFPEWSNSFKRKKDDGRAEAAILAKYGERVYKLQ